MIGFCRWQHGPGAHQQFNTFAGIADTACVDHQIGLAPLSDSVLAVTGQPGLIGHQRIPAACETIEQRRFAHIRTSDKYNNANWAFNVPESAPMAANGDYPAVSWRQRFHCRQTYRRDRCPPPRAADGIVADPYPSHQATVSARKPVQVPSKSPTTIFSTPPGGESQRAEKIAVFPDGCTAAGLIAHTCPARQPHKGYSSRHPAQQTKRVFTPVKTGHVTPKRDKMAPPPVFHHPLNSMPRMVSQHNSTGQIQSNQLAAGELQMTISGDYRRAAAVA